LPKDVVSVHVSNQPKSPALDDAIEVFNRGGYFDAAEMFEQAALAADEELKTLARALGQIAAALHMRFERGARQSSINLLSQAMSALDDLQPARGGIDVERLFAEISAYTEEVRAAPRGEAAGLKHSARIFLERRRAPKINRRR
jgi:predicted metal-dependent hydrolase